MRLGICALWNLKTSATTPSPQKSCCTGECTVQLQGAISQIKVTSLARLALGHGAGHSSDFLLKEFWKGWCVICSLSPWNNTSAPKAPLHSHERTPDLHYFNNQRDLVLLREKLSGLYASQFTTELHPLPCMYSKMLDSKSMLISFHLLLLTRSIRE